MMNYATTGRPRQKAALPTSDVGMSAVSLGTQLENAIVLGCPCPRERMFEHDLADCYATHRAAVLTGLAPEQVNLSDTVAKNLSQWRRVPLRFQ